MKTLTLVRIVKTDTYTEGKLYLSGQMLMNTLEPADKGLNELSTIDDILEAKEQGKCAIPYGTYNVEMYQSPKFGKLVPRLQNVLGFEAIEIHVGNSVADTDGCILVGMVCDSVNGTLSYSLSATRVLNDYLSAGSNDSIQIVIKPS